MTGINNGQMRISATYDYNYLHSIFDASKKINDRLRTRTSQSVLISFLWGFHSNYSLGLLLTHNRQERRSYRIEGPEEFVIVSGIGDLVLLGQYVVFKPIILSPHRMETGLGIKIPTGKHKVRTNQILLPPDLQPGNGSLDLIIQLFYSHRYLPTSKLSYSMASSIQLTGKIYWA